MEVLRRSMEDTSRTDAEEWNGELMDSSTTSAAPDAAAALTGLLADSAAAAADAGQSETPRKACAPLCTAPSHRMRCSCALRMRLCRCPAGLGWSDRASGLR